MALLLEILAQPCFGGAGLNGKPGMELFILWSIKKGVNCTGFVFIGSLVNIQTYLASTLIRSLFIWGWKAEKVKRKWL